MEAEVYYIHLYTADSHLTYGKHYEYWCGKCFTRDGLLFPADPKYYGFTEKGKPYQSLKVTIKSGKNVIEKLAYAYNFTVENNDGDVVYNYADDGNESRINVDHSLLHNVKQCEYKKEGYVNAGRYLLFAYLEYYPTGGMNDCIFKTNDIGELNSYAKEYAEKEIFYDYMDYYDCQTGETYEAEIEEHDGNPEKKFVRWRRKEDEME